MHAKNSHNQQAVAELRQAHFATLDDALHAVTRTAARVLNVDRTGIWLFSDPTTAIYCAHEHVSEHRQPPSTRDRGRPLPSTNCINVLHFAADEPYMLKLHQDAVVAYESTDTEHASPRFQDYLHGLGSRSLLDVPLRIGGNLVGMLSHESTPRRCWQKEELTLAIRLADIASVAMENNRSRLSTLAGDRYQALIEQTPNSVALCDSNGRLEYLNPSARRLFGLAPDEPIRCHRLTDFMVPGADTWLLQKGAIQAHSNGAWSGELTLRSCSGNELDAHVAITSYRTDDGTIDYTSYVLRNTSTQTQLKRQLQDTQARYEAVIAETGDAIFHVNVATGGLSHVNSASSHILGYSIDELERMTAFDVVADTVDNIRHYMDTCVAEGRINLAQRKYRHRNGRNVDLEVAVVTFMDGDKPMLDVRARDITALLQRRRDIERLAYYDPVTGLANSNLLRERGETLLAQSLDGDMTPVCYIITQIGSWQRLVDTLGYEAAESLLKQAAERLQELVGDRDIPVARLLAGAEFGLLFETTEQSAQALIAEINEAFALPLSVDDESVHLTLRSGLANFPAHATNFKELAMRAGIALRQAELKNKPFCIYDVAQSHQLHDEHLLEEDLRQAIGTQQIRLHYQPVFRADGSPSGMEALVRWQHPQLGWLPPDHFIPLAEESGLIVDLDFCVMVNAIREASSWLPELPDLRVGFNCSALTLTDARLLEHLRRTLNDYPLPPTQITVEVTETTLIHDRQAASRALAQLADLGIKIALDDFGTGYSSLAYIKNLPIKMLKIDRTFISGIGTDVRDERAIEAIISLGHDLDLQVLAEGVETRAQGNWLMARNIDYMQGYYFGKPQPMAEVRRKFLDKPSN